MVYILLGQGFEEVEAITPYDLLSRAEIPVCFAGIGGKWITGSHGIALDAEIAVEDIVPHDAEMIVLPGGRGGVESILASQVACSKVMQVWEQGGYAAAICAAPVILESLGITDGKCVTCYPQEIWESQMLRGHLVQGVSAVRDGRVITGASAGCATEFSLELIAALRGDDLAQKIRKELVIL